MSEVEDSKGIWRMVAAVVDGKDMPFVQGVVMEVDDAGFAIKVNGKPYQKGMARVDPGMKPGESLTVVSEGKDAGQLIPQITRREGNVLIGCSSRPGHPAPSSFSSEAGSGQALSVWLRDARAVELSRRHAGWGRWAFLFLLPVLFLADDLDTWKRDLEPTLGYWGSLAAIGLCLTTIQVVVFVLLKWGWRAGLAIGLGLSSAILVDKELTQAIEPTLHHAGAVLVALATALVAGFIALKGTAFALKVRV